MEFAEYRGASRVFDAGHYLERYPALGDEIGAMLAQIDRASTTASESLPGELNGPDFGGLERLGHYRIERELGRGGQGIVYLAQDEHLGRPVALKVLSGWSSMSSAAWARFQREAQLASRLDDPGLCTVYSADTLDGVPYVARRYVAGKSLEVLLREERSESRSRYISAGLELIEQAARSVHAAHQQGVVHRDLKPGNIIVEPGGRPVVLDFGLARELEGEGGTLTATGDVFGTPAYMAPEQVRGQRVDRRADVWALGVVLYEWIAGRRPFEAPTRDSLYRSVLEDGPHKAPRKLAGVGPDLAVVLETALAKQPDARYADAAALADDLAAVRAGRPISARRPSLPLRAVRWARREPLLAGTALALAVAVTGAAGLGGYVRATSPMRAAGEAQALADRIEDLLVVGAGFGSEEGAGRTSLERALELDPATDLARAGLAVHFLDPTSGERPERALQVLEAAPEPTPALRRMRAAVLRELDRGTEAQAIEEELGPPVRMNDAFIMGRILFEGIGLEGEPRPAESLAHFTRALLLSPRPRELFHLARLRGAFAAKESEIAVEQAEAALALWPDSVYTNFLAGLAYSRVDMDRSLACYERTVELDPEFHLAYTSLGAFYAFKARWEDSDAAFQRAFDTAPDTAGRSGVRVIQSKMATHCEEHGAALRYAREAVDLAPEDERARALLASLEAPDATDLDAE